MPLAVLVKPVSTINLAVARGRENGHGSCGYVATPPPPTLRPLAPLSFTSTLMKPTLRTSGELRAVPLRVVPPLPSPHPSSARNGAALGQVLLERSLITQEQLTIAIEHQRTTDR